MSVLNKGLSPLSSFSNNSHYNSNKNLNKSNTLLLQNNNGASMRINPLAFQSLRNIDVDKLEEDLAKEIQRKKISDEREKVKIIY
jgi:hypothetical protein